MKEHRCAFVGLSTTLGGRKLPRPTNTPMNHGLRTAHPHVQRARGVGNRATDPLGTPPAGEQNPGSATEEVEFRIYPDGRVEQFVRGVKGNSCVDLTRPFEEVLGQVVHQEPTAEYFEDPLTEQASETLSDSW
mmetsp:Transcript_5649/g.11291  ORF Transcript_5649/g.11291 Transcript_5649/m.11291 type:complete len:133 (+) Transcript_5649:60-458(+)